MEILSPGALEHLRDLRRRVMIALAAVAVATTGLYMVKAQVMDALLWPLQGVQDSYLRVVYTGVPELFFLYLKISTWGGVFIALPLMLWLAWGFVAPGLYKKERLLVGPLLAAVPVLFYVGGIFAYGVIVPVALKYFFGFDQPGVTAQPSLAEYLSFLFTMAFAFGLAFNLPVFLLLLVKAGWVKLATLRGYRRFVVVLILVVAAILTPPDPFSQIAMAVPLYLLYEAAIIAARLLKLDAD
ncbi:MAG: twin-arginine translocase subunit TatC [Proteobacteria bacterium]|nr:twin-arginine translocase subunit TatC [Pseudomonadota bacterium]